MQQYSWRPDHQYFIDRTLKKRLLPVAFPNNQIADGESQDMVYLI